MADEDNTQTGGDAGGDTAGPSQEVITKASEMGWVPQEKFRGDPDRWVDAETFVRKGEEVLPLIRAGNRKLNERLSDAARENQVLQANIAELRESIGVMQDVQRRESAARLDRQIKVLRREIEEARVERDPDKVVEIQERMDALTEEKGKLAEEKEEPKKEGSTAPDPRIREEVDAWQEENPWFGQHRLKTRLANAISTELRNDPKFRGIVGRPFLEEVTKRTEEAYEEEFGGTPSNKTSGGSQSGTRNSAGGGGGTRRGKSFNDLPADARAACNADMDRLVGPNKVYKTASDYQKFYVQEYFGEEA